MEKEPRKPVAAASTGNLRRSPRFRTLKSAKLLPMGSWEPVDGVVRDQSDNGARISCESPETVPDEFRLVVVKEATIQPCSVKWRGEQQMGVEYSGEAKPAPPRKL